MRILLALLVVFFAGLLCVSNVVAEEAEQIVVFGEITVVEEGGQIVKATVKEVEKLDDEEIITVYIIKLDDIGKKLAKELKGKMVQIEGLFTEVEKGDDFENHLQVIKFKMKEKGEGDKEEVEVEVD
ncbi:MAG: hypothetical protein JW808_08990 [Victivallales bacterium]|nr:hypothetical protein [Victivallales bacterium]